MIVNLWKKLNDFNSDVARIFTLTKWNGTLVVSKADKATMIVLAPLLIVFFCYVRSSLIEMLGHGFADVAVRIFLEEMYVTFLAFVLLAFIRCFLSFKWLDALLAIATGKLILVVELIYLSPFMILGLAAIVNLRH